MDTLDKILYLLEQQGKTQKELSDYLGLQKNAVSQWKQKTNTSYIKYASQIAKFFNVPVGYLLEEDQAKSDISEQKNNPLNAEASNGKDKLEGVHFYTPPAHLRKSNYTPPASPIEGVWTDINKSDEPGVAMDDLDREMLSLFQQLPQGERYKLIGRLEALLEKWK